MESFRGSRISLVLVVVVVVVVVSLLHSGNKEIHCPTSILILGDGGGGIYYRGSAYNENLAPQNLQVLKLI